MQTELGDKYDRLLSILRGYGSVVVAFSGGVDSAFLLAAASEALGDGVLAATATSCSFPVRERDEAIEFCRERGIRHSLVESEELSIEGFRQNPTNRCYMCKRELFEKLLALADENNMSEVVEGSNTDDEGDYRPGLMAIAELGIKSPLREAGLSKGEIRELSRELGLPTADKQSFACLASRFVYGEEITEKKLSMVDRAEQLLIDLGFRQLRVRIHGNIARIEVEPDAMGEVLSHREEIDKTFREIGFTYVTMDLRGYRTGSMNEVLPYANSKGAADARKE